MKKIIAMVAILSFTGFSYAQDDVLFKNVNIFDGEQPKLSMGMQVLVQGNKISKISESIVAPAGAKVIDGKGKTLTPGLIDAHVHLMWNMSPYALMDGQPDYISARSLKEAENTLMRGFTTIRDTAGQVFGVQRAINEGLFIGPRIYGSGAGISMTSGHGDLRMLNTLPRQMGGSPESEVERIGMVIIADGVPEVLTATRMQFRKGADFAKLFIGGAVSGLRDPLDISEFSFDEIKAAADEAKRWNSYLAVHGYTDDAIKTALEAGAMSIEHGNLLSEETIKLIKKKGAYLSTQTGVYLGEAPADWNPDQVAKQQAAKNGLANMFKLAKKHKLKLALGTDLIGAAKPEQSKELSNRLEWFSPAEILIQATSNNAELLAMSGPRNPYPGKLGVIQEGAYADILLIDGNPLENLHLIDEPEKNIAVIMKDGVIYKDITK